MEAPRTFSLFPNLPSEIRLKIWRHALPGPRTVRIRLEYMSKKPEEAGWKSSITIPIGLHICHESRQETLRFYQLAFGSYFRNSSIFISFDIDTVQFVNKGSENSSPLREPANYLLDVLLGSDFHATDGQKIQRLVLEVDEALYDRRPFCWDEIRLLTGLKHLTMVPFEALSAADELVLYYRRTLSAVARTNPEWVVPEIWVITRSGEDWGTVNADETERAVD